MAGAAYILVGLISSTGATPDLTTAAATLP
jgi:hypothetical protein